MKSAISVDHELATLSRFVAWGNGERDCRKLSDAPVLAAILGGIIGLERELNHRPTGLRTNMFICFGAALFTVLSAALAGIPSDAARIAAQIIPGIGFIGAGSILHTRGLTSGITSAATLFVVASIGMAAGGGLYVTAMFATGVVLLALFLLGHLEETFNLKVLLSSYEVTGASVEEISNEVNRILEKSSSPDAKCE